MGPQKYKAQLLLTYIKLHLIFRSEWYFKMKYFKKRRNLLIWGLLFFISCSSSNIKEEQVVARVGSEVLTLDELDSKIPENLKHRITVDQLKGLILHWVNTQLVYQQAYRLGLHNTLSAELQKELKKFEIEFLANKLVEREINRKIQVLDENVKAHYEKNKEQFTRISNEIRAFHLLTRSSENSTEISKALKNGRKLEELKEEYKVPNSLWPNGDLGYFPVDALPAHIKKEMSKLKTGQTSKPIKTDLGYHFFTIIDRQPQGSIKSLEEVYESILEKLKVTKRREEYEAYLYKLQTRAKQQQQLKINYENLKEFQQDTTSILGN